MVISPQTMAKVRNGNSTTPSCIIGYLIIMGMPSVGSPPPKRKQKATTNPTKEPIEFAFLSNKAVTNCGKSNVYTRSLHKNHNA